MVCFMAGTSAEKTFKFHFVIFPVSVLGSECTAVRSLYIPPRIRSGKAALYVTLLSLRV